MTIFRTLHQWLTVGAKVGLLLGTMLLVAGVNVGVVYVYQSQVSTVSNSVNYAGQQRMLSQRMARYANNIAQSSSAAAQDELAATVDKFNRNLETLRNGGTINGSRLRPAPEGLHDELKREEELWGEYREHARTLATSSSDEQAADSALAYVQANSDKLLDVSDEVTSAFAAHASSKTALMKKLLLVLFAVNVVVFGFGTYLGRAYIGVPIREIAAVADELAQGDLDTDVSSAVSLQSEVTVAEGRLNDELKRLMQSFEGLQAYLTTAAHQAKALANKDFDAQVLEEDIPGEFGRALGQMQRDLRELVGNLERLNDQLEAKAEAYQAVMERAANGDLTQRMDPEGESEAMVQIGKTFNEMIEEFEGTITRISDFAEDVAASSQQVSVNVEEIQSASQQVGVSIQEISTGADVQNENLNEVSGEMLHLSEAIEEAAGSASEVASTAEHTAELGVTGRESASDAIEGMRAIESKTNETTEKVESLAHEVEEISEFVGMINDITEQTNLLALNASIEAARAGEAGEGFAVVAEEIKELAEETAEATETIEALIGEVQSSTTEAVEDMRQMGAQVSAGAETIEESLQALEDIADRVEDANRSIQEISKVTDEQASSTEEVVGKIDEVAGVAQQTSTEAASVSAAAEEQTRSLTEMSDSIQSLAERTEELREMLDNFSTHGQSSGDGAVIDAEVEGAFRASSNGSRS